MSVLTEIKWSYIPKHTFFRVCTTANVKIGKKVTIHNSRIIVTPGSSIEIGDNVTIENSEISVDHGKCIIGDHSLIGSRESRLLLNIETGDVSIGHHSKISVRRLWIRFCGILSIGDYTNINGGGEIRCDERIAIGSYNQISYNVNIWDTNTHNILPVDERRFVAQKYYPYFGKETSRPSTVPITIGDDCWIGQNSTILKGTILGDEVIVGFNTIIPGKVIPSKTTVVANVELKMIQR